MNPIQDAEPILFRFDQLYFQSQISCDFSLFLNFKAGEILVLNNSLFKKLYYYKYMLKFGIVKNFIGKSIFLGDSN